MAEVTTQGNEILVQAGSSSSRIGQDAGSELVSWIVGKVKPWEDFRDRGYQKRWGEYWRLWRGQWDEADKNRMSERSRLIAPALAQAIEATVAEAEETFFGKDIWLDIVDDIADKEKKDAILVRDQLLEDFDKTNVPDTIIEAILNAAIFGTGLLKISVEVTTDYKPSKGADQKLQAAGEERVYVCVTAPRPDEFIPDPSGINISDMLGCAHRVSRPKHSVLEKIERGVYLSSARDNLFGIYKTSESAVDGTDPEAFLRPGDSESIDVLEYHGKVPARLLAKISAKSEAIDEIVFDDDNGEDGPLIEAIVTIANEGTLLRAMKNPFTMTDRSIIAFQFEKVPGRFWGRGVAEKGYNPQKALDAELRARQDALGFISAPMLGVDAGRIPRGFRMEVKPGKVWLTNGDPAEVLRPITLGDLNAATFNQTQEMERMVQMGTGAFDTASALGAQSQSGANGASANSGLMSAFVKRAKRAIRQIERNAIMPLVKKSLWRYMQFEPQRYPKDYDFVVKASLGIVAREVEAMQLTQLLGMLPEQAPGVALAVAQGIVDNSAVSNKVQIVKAIELASQPPPPEVAQRQKELEDMQFEAVKADAQGKLLENQKTMAEIRKILAEASAVANRGRLDVIETQQEQQRVTLQGQELDQFQLQNVISYKRLALQERALEAKIADQSRKNSANN